MGKNGIPKMAMFCNHQDNNHLAYSHSLWILFCNAEPTNRTRIIFLSFFHRAEKFLPIIFHLQASREGCAHRMNRFCQDKGGVKGDDLVDPILEQRRKENAGADARIQKF